jgi:hypothetical protein
MNYIETVSNILFEIDITVENINNQIVLTDNTLHEIDKLFKAYRFGTEVTLTLGDLGKYFIKSNEEVIGLLAPEFDIRYKTYSVRIYLFNTIYTTRLVTDPTELGPHLLELLNNLCLNIKGKLG